MHALLKISRLIDGMSRFIGRWVIWLILASTLISAVNAIVRKAFNYSSNAFLEMQWYLFAASFLLAAGFTLLNNEHVRIDVVVGRFSKRTQTWIDVFGFVVFLMPVCATIIYLGTPFFLQALRSGEISTNAGGLILWPVYALIPLGFGLLMLQGFSELIKRLAFLQGLIDDPTLKPVAKTAEEELAEAIRLAAEQKKN
ncbi:TRAP transporter small permease subunit [Roseateles oligotrophus]|uniref:TRAP transporter small permease protein n=1 Tax=Roseateles oligotrophus TaxID=1769250 RepID=A0ABT2YME5_9BURK|nr:TRAP transporter small permease subunit [Roseateles oligotrophus]MCV2371237.1 TRAP transporter small permease subunit [Roseateles oligotrophus]